MSSGSVIIKKDQSNLIGISIGGGAPYCPCLYIVQVINPILKHTLIMAKTLVRLIEHIGNPSGSN